LVLKNGILATLIPTISRLSFNRIYQQYLIKTHQKDFILTNPTLSITDVVRQSLAFLSKDSLSKHDLSKDKNNSSINQPFTGLIIGNDTQSVFTQIQAIDEAIDQAVSWEAFDYQEFIAHRFAKRYDLAVIILSNDSAIDTQIIQRCRDLFAKHCLLVQNLSEPATGVDVASFGFSRLHEQPIVENDQDHHTTNYQVWQFNLFDYKHLPDWFNSKFWANPELWNKFRW